MSTQIPVQSVELLYAEGRIGFTEQFMKTYEDLDKSDVALRSMASDAPSCGSYNKVGYKVTFADGETYEGRICLKRHDEFHSRIISRSMGSFVGFHAGRHCPDHMTRKSYQQFLDRLGDETLKEYADFQDQYSF